MGSVLGMGGMGLDPGIEEAEAPWRVAAKRPHEVFRFNGGQMTVRAENLREDEARFAAEIAALLNESSRQGWVIIHDNADVELTESGRRTFLSVLESSGLVGCMEFSDLDVSWLGYSVTLEQTCSDTELEKRVQSMASELSPEGTDGLSSAAMRSPQWHTNPLPALFGQDVNCLLSLVSLGFGWFSIFLLLASLP